MVKHSENIAIPSSADMPRPVFFLFPKEKFLRIKVYKRHLQRTTHVKALQRKPLEDELTFKSKHLATLEQELSDTLTQLQSHTSKIDFSALKLWLTRKQFRVVAKIKLTHENKLRKLQLSPLSSGLNVDSHF